MAPNHPNKNHEGPEQPLSSVFPDMVHDADVAAAMNASVNRPDGPVPNVENGAEFALLSSTSRTDDDATDQPSRGGDVDVDIQAIAPPTSARRSLTDDDETDQPFDLPLKAHGTDDDKTDQPIVRFHGNGVNISNAGTQDNAQQFARGADDAPPQHAPPPPGQGEVFPTELDKIFGRGKALLQHPGNIAFQNLINDHKNEWKSSKKHAAKATIRDEIFVTFQARGGRILKANKSHAQYMDHPCSQLTVKEAKDKISKALGEADKDVKAQKRKARQQKEKDKKKETSQEPPFGGTVALSSTNDFTSVETPDGGAQGHGTQWLQVDVDGCFSTAAREAANVTPISQPDEPPTQQQPLGSHNDGLEIQDSDAMHPENYDLGHVEMENTAMFVEGRDGDNEMNSEPPSEGELQLNHPTLASGQVDKEDDGAPPGHNETATREIGGDWAIDESALSPLEVDKVDEADFLLDDIDPNEALPPDTPMIVESLAMEEKIILANDTHRESDDSPPDLVDEKPTRGETDGNDGLIPVADVQDENKDDIAGQGSTTTDVENLAVVADVAEDKAKQDQSEPNETKKADQNPQPSSPSFFRRLFSCLLCQTQRYSEGDP